jgi:uncharacterized protein YeaO (DUF488 family)
VEAQGGRIWVEPEGERTTFKLTLPAAKSEPVRGARDEQWRGLRSEGEAMIRIKRTYDPPARGDGRRVLVERLWPRGMKKEALALDEWRKEVAPSTELRKWFGHRVDRWPEFQRRYEEELDANPGAWEPLANLSRRGTVTLLYSAHDPLHNSAQVLRDHLSRRSPPRLKKRPGQKPKARG